MLQPRAFVGYYVPAVVGSSRQLVGTHHMRGRIPREAAPAACAPATHWSGVTAGSLSALGALPPSRMPSATTAARARLYVPRSNPTGLAQHSAKSMQCCLTPMGMCH